MFQYAITSCVERILRPICKANRNHLITDCQDVPTAGQKKQQQHEVRIANEKHGCKHDTTQPAKSLVLNVQHLFIDLFCGHAASEEGRGRQVAPMTRVCGTHHVLGVKHLLSQLWHGQSTVLLRPAGGQWGKARHEEVQPREGHQVHGNLAQVAVQLAGEAQTTSDPRHGC